jgi:hypothetical protein
MFLAMMVDYGIGGLIVYLVVIVRLVVTARQAARDRDLSGALWVYVGWLMIFSFSSHNLLGNAATIPLLGFALARAYQIQVYARLRSSLEIKLREDQRRWPVPPGEFVSEYPRR